MKNIALPLCAALALAVGLAYAGTDPLLGTWKADIKPGGDLKSQTTTVVAAPGGYTFNNDIQPAQGGAMKMSLAVVPDGKPHTENSAMGPVTSTCHRTAPRTIGCKVSFAGSDSMSDFVLSADGKTLTETDTSMAQRVEYSSATNISENNGKVTQDPTASHTQTSESEQAQSMVFHKQ